MALKDSYAVAAEIAEIYEQAKRADLPGVYVMLLADLVDITRKRAYAAMNALTDAQLRNGANLLSAEIGRATQPPA